MNLSFGSYSSALPLARTESVGRRTREATRLVVAFLNFRTVLANLLSSLWRSSLQGSRHWKMQNVALSICPALAGCICSNSGEICSANRETGLVLHDF